MSNARPFALQGKSLTATPLASGDLALTGYAVVWDGLDIDGENFITGALDAAIPDFLSGPAPMLWHHRQGDQIGRVLSLEPDSKGVKLSAVIFAQAAGSPLFHIYNAIRRGSGVVGLSIGGYFQRAAKGAISKVLRITEVSATSAGAHPQTRANVVEVKAMRDAIGVDDFALRRALCSAAELDLTLTLLRAARTLR